MLSGRCAQGRCLGGEHRVIDRGTRAAEALHRRDDGLDVLMQRRRRGGGFLTNVKRLFANA